MQLTNKQHVFPKRHVINKVKYHVNKHITLRLKTKQITCFPVQIPYFQPLNAKENIKETCYHLITDNI